MYWSTLLSVVLVCSEAVTEAQQDEGLVKSSFNPNTARLHPQRGVNPFPINFPHYHSRPHFKPQYSQNKYFPTKIANISPYPKHQYFFNPLSNIPSYSQPQKPSRYPANLPPYSQPQKQSGYPANLPPYSQPQKQSGYPANLPPYSQPQNPSRYPANLPSYSQPQKPSGYPKKVPPNSQPQKPSDYPKKVPPNSQPQKPSDYPKKFPSNSQPKKPSGYPKKVPPNSQPQNPLNPCPSDSKVGNCSSEHCSKEYTVVAGSKANWFEAFELCARLGRRLATVNSKEEELLLLESITKAGSPADLWLGATDLGHPGQFVWMSSGQPVTYTNYNKADTVKTRNKPCLAFVRTNSRHYEWYKVNCNESRNIACEQSNNNGNRTTNYVMPLDWLKTSLDNDDY